LPKIITSVPPLNLLRPEIVEPCYIDKTEVIDPTARIGANISIGANFKIGFGVWVKNLIVLNDGVLKE
jgi:NDP-sugar pyrophosphorylase family protein